MTRFATEQTIARSADDVWTYATGSGRAVAGGSGASKLDGVMRRSDGRTVIWVDGVPQFEAGPNNAFKAPR